MISNIKDYTCSRDGINYPKLEKPLINLYIQTTPKCNAKCYFCNTRCKSTSFSLDKLKEVIDFMRSKVLIGKVAISGGEPLLEVDRIKGIVSVCDREYITLNTNAYSLEKLSEVYSLVKEVHISKHHYDNAINDEIMKIKTPTMKEISEKGFSDKVKINCVYQKGIMETKTDMVSMMEEMAKYGFSELRNISLLPLTDAATESYVDLVSLMKDAECFTNDGYLYDKGMCQCFELMYVASNGKLVKSLIRQTFNDDYSCVKQLVFDGEHLYDGFKKKNILI